MRQQRVRLAGFFLLATQLSCTGIIETPEAQVETADELGYVTLPEGVASEWVAVEAPQAPLPELDGATLQSQPEAPVEPLIGDEVQADVAAPGGNSWDAMLVETENPKLDPALTGGAR